MLYDILKTKEKKFITVYEEGEIIISQGDKLNNIKIMIEGEAFTNSYSLNGDRAITNILTELQFIGLIEAIAKESESLANVVALRKCLIIKVPIEKFFFEMRSDIRFSNVCIEYLSNFSLNLIKDRQANRDALPEINILNFLYINALDKKLPAKLSFSKEFIADFFNVNVRSVYRYLNKWEDNSFIQRKGQNIIIDQKNIVLLKEKLCSYFK